MNRSNYILPLALFASLTITACGSVNKDWASATAENTAAGYQAFVDKHSSDPLAQEARARLANLQDDSSWKNAQNGQSLDSYQQYLQSEPQGNHAQAARDQIATLEQATAWKAAQMQGTPAALDAFLQKYPQGQEADQARKELVALNAKYQAELGSFRDRRAADRRLAELKSRFSGTLKEVEVLSPDSSNKRYRVVSGLMDRHDADSACASLKQDHQSCEVVKAAEIHS